MEEGDVTVATFDSKTRAFMVVDTLKAEGVPSAYVPLGADDGGSGPTVIPYQVRVRSVDADLARRILADFGYPLAA